MRSLGFASWQIGLLIVVYGQVFSQQLSPQTYDPKLHVAAAGDWLLARVANRAKVLKSEDGKDIILFNGLLRRTFRISPDVACTDFTNLSNGRQLLRTVAEEARLTVDGKIYNVGGLIGIRQKAYLDNAWIDHLTADSTSFGFVSYRVQEISPVWSWKVGPFWSDGASYGSGKELSFLFRSKLRALAGIEVRINYELFDGIPLIVKSLQVINNSGRRVTLGRVVNEVLNLVEEESSVEGSFDKMNKPSGLYVETNYAFNNSMNYTNSDQTTHWKPDSSYTSQVHYRYQTPVRLEIYPEQVTGIMLENGAKFQSLRSHELLIDNGDRERRGLAIKRMYRTVAPWTTANPIFMHLVSSNDLQVRSAIDQCVATGYEALIISFGSHLDMEDTTAANRSRWKEIAAYAHHKGIRIGCYSLFSSRSISDADDVIDPVTGRPNVHSMFGKAPCFGSRWGLWYRDNIKRFFLETGFDIWEHDGPFAGDVCASTSHPGHRGVGDSQWEQLQIQKELYHWLNARGVYINSPDWNFLDGANKIGLGYREVNFKLPRDQQKLLNRQNIFDGTWEKTPSMSWGFVPLTEYGGGGPESVLEPLGEHLADYQQLMMQYYGAGVQAFYRGPRLYDGEVTRQMVAGVISWYKKYRGILNADIIHLRRPDGRDWDGILHVNPMLKQKGMLMLYNPTEKPITRTIKVPLYYTGLDQVAMVREQEKAPVKYTINRDYTIDLVFTLGPLAYSWFVIE